MTESKVFSAKEEIVKLYKHAHESNDIKLAYEILMQMVCNMNALDTDNKDKTSPEPVKEKEYVVSLMCGNCKWENPMRIAFGIFHPDILICNNCGYTTHNPNAQRCL